MPAMPERILFVKLSSLGDVIHNLPAVTDLALARPDAHIAWAVEEAYAPLVRLHPAVREAIPVALRALRARPHAARAWRALGAARESLAAGSWDAIVDTQGLVKSALVARAARGRRLGPDRESAREPLAARLYHVAIAVPRAMHAVERNRMLAGRALGYEPRGPARYGIAAAAQPPSWAPRTPYAVLLHAASRADKQWPAESWMALATELVRRGVIPVLPGGSDAEREAAARLAAQVPGAIAAPAVDLPNAAALIAHASFVAGVDTGLTHLAVALGRPTVGIYRVTEPALTGLHGTRAVSLGGPGREPTPAQVLEALVRT